MAPAAAEEINAKVAEACREGEEWCENAEDALVEEMQMDQESLLLEKVRAGPAVVERIHSATAAAERIVVDLHAALHRRARSSGDGGYHLTCGGEEATMPARTGYVRRRASSQLPRCTPSNPPLHHGVPRGERRNQFILTPLQGRRARARSPLAWHARRRSPLISTSLPTRLRADRLGRHRSLSGGMARPRGSHPGTSRRAAKTGYQGGTVGGVSFALMLLELLLLASSALGVTSTSFSKSTTSRVAAATTTPKYNSIEIHKLTKTFATAAVFDNPRPASAVELVSMAVQDDRRKLQLQVRFGNPAIALLSLIGEVQASRDGTHARLSLEWDVQPNPVCDLSSVLEYPPCLHCPLSS